MTHKLMIGGFAVTTAFLLATNPVVVDAAGLVTGAQIKNSSVTGKDVKNRSLSGKDLKKGTVPVEVKAFERFAGQEPLGGTLLGTTMTAGFYGPTSSVKVDADDVLVASASAVVVAANTGDDYSYGICTRPVGSSAAPSPLGGLAAMFEDVDTVAGQNVASSDASAVLGAGSYTVGWCARNIQGSNTLVTASGWVQVLGGATGGL